MYPKVGTPEVKSWIDAARNQKQRGHEVVWTLVKKTFKGK
jgi:hypothetical protein